MTCARRSVLFECLAVMLLVLPATGVAAETRVTVRDLLDQVDTVDQANADVVKAVSDFAAKSKAIALQLQDLDTQNAALSAKKAELAALCSGEYEKMEYERRKAICDEQLPALNKQIDDLAERRQTLLAEQGSISPSQSDLAARIKDVQAQVADTTTAAQSLPEAGNTVAACTGAPVSGGAWRQCMRTNLCAVATARAARTRAAVEALQRELATNQSELAYWGKLNGEAQMGAIEAAAKFWLGEYAANQLEQKKRLNSLVKQAERLAAKAGDAKKAAVEARYLRELKAVVTKMGPPMTDLVLRDTTKTALDVESRWSVVRDTLRLEMNTARKNDEDLKSILEDPKFRDAFKSSEIDSPGYDLSATVVEDTLGELAKHMITVETFEKSVAPQVRAAVFVRDSGYNALLSLLSTERVLQQADLATSLAKASGVLQQQNESDVLDLAACTSRN